MDCQGKIGFWLGFHFFLARISLITLFFLVCFVVGVPPRYSLLGKHASSRATYKDFNSCLYLSWSPIQYQTTVFLSLTARARKSKFTLTDQILSAEFTHLKWSDGWKGSFFQSPNLVSACFLISSDNSLYESQYDFTVNEFIKVSSFFLPYGP